MNRRSFLRGVLAASIVAKVTPVLETVSRIAPEPIASIAEKAYSIADSLIVDPIGKTISWAVPSEEATFSEVYAYLAEVFNEESVLDLDAPIRAVPTTLRVSDGWFIPKRCWWAFWRR